MDVSEGSPLDLGTGVALVDSPAAQSECGHEIANVDTKMAQEESVNDPAIHESISSQPVVMDVDHGDLNDDELPPLVIDLCPVDPRIPVHTEKVAVTENTFPAGKNTREKPCISTSFPSNLSILRSIFIFFTFYSISFFMAIHFPWPSIFHGHPFFNFFVYISHFESLTYNESTLMFFLHMICSYFVNVSVGYNEIWLFLITIHY